MRGSLLLRILSLLLLVAQACAIRGPSLGPVRGQAVEANQSGLRQHGLGNLSSAQAQFERALRLNRSIDNRKGALVNLNNIGTIRLKNSDPDSALVYFQEALEMARELSDRDAEADLLIQLGAVHEIKGKQAEALSYFESAETLARTHGNSRGLRSALGRLGRLKISVREWGQARNRLEEAYRLDKTANDERGMALRESDLGLLAFHQDQPEEAAALFTKALERFQRLEDPWGVALNLQRASRVHLAMKAYPQAERFANRALFAHLAVDDLPGAVGDLLILARIYHAMGDTLEVTKKLDQARSLLEREDREDLREKIDNLGASLEEKRP